MDEDTRKAVLNRTINRVTLKDLYCTREGADKLQDILLALTNRCSLTSIAAAIGIHPNTLSVWIRKGKDDMRKWKEGDEKSYHLMFIEDVMKSTGVAVSNAEAIVHEQDPKFYLQKGWARTLINDVYNIEGLHNYNMDGTVSPLDDDSASIRINEGQQKAIEVSREEKEDSQNKALSLDALATMRENGIDVNDVIDRLLEHKRKNIR